MATPSASARGPPVQSSLLKQIGQLAHLLGDFKSSERVFYLAESVTHYKTLNLVKHSLKVDGRDSHDKLPMRRHEFFSRDIGLDESFLTSFDDQLERPIEVR